MLAAASLCGLPVQRIVEGDDVERQLWLKVAQRAAEVRVQMMKAQASYNAAQIRKLFGRG